ncbi:MAG: exodeoxyribonuclease VII large subunit, partial [Acidimicrobiia bacterium]|nr:exodeoxyribonuclease VII large subunit [Acidimicrobiia bacterium]
RGGARRPLADGERQLRVAAERLVARLPRLLDAETRHLASVESRVRALDPVNVLARGWSITRGADGTVLRTPAGTTEGDTITTQLAGGTLTSRVDSTEGSAP